MLKRRIFVPIFIVAINLALTGFLFAQVEVALAQGATPAPAEEAPAQAAPTPAPAEEAPPATLAEPTPTAAAVEQAAPAADAAPAEVTPSTMPTTGMASDPLSVMLVVIGMVVVLGTLSAYSSHRKRTSQE